MTAPTVIYAGDLLLGAASGLGTRLGAASSLSRYGAAIAERFLGAASAELGASFNAASRRVKAEF